MSLDLSQVDEKDLQEELRKRAEERNRIAQKERDRKLAEQRQRWFNNIDFLISEYEHYESCKQLEYRDVHRCERCALEEIKRLGEWPNLSYVNIEFRNPFIPRKSIRDALLSPGILIANQAESVQ